jgi:hypothetical protein
MSGQNKSIAELLIFHEEQLLGFVSDHALNLVAAFILKVVDNVAWLWATLTLDLTKDLAFALINGNVTTSFPVWWVTWAGVPTTEAVGNYTSCFVTQINTLIGRVMEALLLVLVEYLLHAFPSSFFVGVCFPVTVAAIPAPVLNLAVNPCLEVPPCIGTIATHILPELLSSSPTFPQAVIKVGRAASTILVGTVTIALTAYPFAVVAVVSAAIVSTVLARSVVTSASAAVPTISIARSRLPNPLASITVVITSIPATTIAVAFAVVAYSDEHIAVQLVRRFGRLIIS